MNTFFCFALRGSSPKCVHIQYCSENVHVYYHVNWLQLHLCYNCSYINLTKGRRLQYINGPNSFVGLRLFYLPKNSGMLKLGANKHLDLTSLSLQDRLWGGVLKSTTESFCATEFVFFFPRVFSDVQARVRSQGFHASMSHLRNYPYFPTSHKVPDILIAGTIHQMAFVAGREILACEKTVWVEYCTVKT